MSDLGLIYCPAADPELGSSTKLKSFHISQKTAHEIKRGFDDMGCHCTKEEVKLIKKWMNTDPYETTFGQFGEFVNKNLQYGIKDKVELGFACLRAFMKGIVKIKPNGFVENEFSFFDEKSGKEIKFSMPTSVGKSLSDKKIMWW